MKKTFATFTIINLLLISNCAIASEKISLNYNVMPYIANGYVVDSNCTDYITFSLFENENELFYNNETLKIENNKFSIPISNLSGECKFTISNSLGESVDYTYYISSEDGYLKDYKFEELKNSNYKTYIKTIDNITIIYTNKDKKIITELEKIIKSLPNNLTTNLSEIRLVPANHESKAAGVTKYNKITLYNLSNYSKTTIKNIVIHEIAHTWSYALMQNKILDFSYTDYKQAVKKDKKFPSNYARENVKNGDYSEDFAESISFYLINTKSFTKKYPARAEYIKNIIEN